MKLKQGDIFWAGLDPVKGHEQAGLRPVLILQNDLFNEHLNTVLVAPLTTNLKAKDFVTTYFISGKEIQTKKDSVVLLHQTRCIDGSRLQKKIGSVRADEVRQIKLRLALLF